MGLFERKPSREKKNFVLALYPEEHEALQWLAEAQERSMTDLVLHALSETYGPALAQFNGPELDRRSTSSFPAPLVSDIQDRKTTPQVSAHKKAAGIKR